MQIIDQYSSEANPLTKATNAATRFLVSSMKSKMKVAELDDDR